MQSNAGEQTSEWQSGEREREADRIELTSGQDGQLAGMASRASRASRLSAGQVGLT